MRPKRLGNGLPDEVWDLRWFCGRLRCWFCRRHWFWLFSAWLDLLCLGEHIWDGNGLVVGTTLRP
jgi:hypothetical protein